MLRLPTIPVLSFLVRHKRGSKVDFQSAVHRDHVTTSLIKLHWLSAVDRVNFKVETPVYRCLHDLTPSYLSSLLYRLLDVDSDRYQSQVISRH